MKQLLTLWAELQQCLPVISEFLASLPQDSLPDELVAFLSYLWSKATAPFSSGVTSVNSERGDCYNNELAFFPNLPLVRNRELYSQAYANMKAKQERSCGKEYMGHPSLLPGIFTIYCQHGN